MVDANNNNFKKFVYDPLNKLQEIGTSLSDFEEIENSGIRYTLLGKGNFGYAEKMKSKKISSNSKNKCIFAIKKLVINNPNFKPKDILRETEIMISLDHKNIVKLYGYFTDKEKIDKFKEIYQGKPNIENEKEDKDVICLVLEYVENGTLEGYYKKHMENNKKNSQFNPIDQNFIIKVSKQLLDALQYLGSKSIMHRDIKPDNILLDENYDVKISDFGISALFYDLNPENMRKHKQLFSNFSMVGRQDFVSPEIEAGNSYDFRVDTYGAGLTMLCLMSYEYPINLLRDQVSNKVNRDIDFNKIHHNYNIYLKQLVFRMTDNNIQLRPYANEALEQLNYIEEMIKNPQNPFTKDYLDKINDAFMKKSQELKNKFKINLDINFNQNNNNQNNFNNNQNNFNNNQNNFNNNQNNFNNNQHNFNNNQNFYNNNQNFYNNNQNNINNPNFVNNQNYFAIQNNMNFQRGNQNNIYNQNYQNQMGVLRHNSNKNVPNMQMVNSQQVPIYQYNQSYLFNPNFNFINLLQKMQMKPVDLSQSSDNIYLVQNNTALIRVLQCIYEIVKNQKSLEQTIFIINECKKYRQDLSFSLSIIYILDIIGKNNSGQININEFTNTIQNFRNLLITKVERFNKNSSQMIPKWIFYEIFSNFNKEIIDNEIPWQNNLFDGLEEPDYLRKNSFPNVYENIEQFKNNYRNIFVENFYFIILNLTVCLKCNSIINVETGVSSLLNLDANTIDNVSNLIKKELLDDDYNNNHNNYFCPKCSQYSFGKTHKAFLNTPRFLLIDFYGTTKNTKKLEMEINLEDYILTNKGSKKYGLFGFICEEQNRKYSAYIYSNDSWTKYSEDNKIEKQYNIGSLNIYYPHMAIYRRI